jgi:Raf kinase inhibitor-like YbhB/YbcL family protein
MGVARWQNSAQIRDSDTAALQPLARNTAMRVFVTALVTTLFVVSASAADNPAATKPAAKPQTSKFHLVSADIAQGRTVRAAQVFNGFGCSGNNISPELVWHNAPAGTKSFALMVHDPDAPTGSGWWHWVVYNIPATADRIASGAGTAEGTKLPTGTRQGITDFGARGYGGPCPPPGTKPHRYFFRLHALKVDSIDVPDNASAAMVGFNVSANTIAVAEIMALYGR